MGTARGNLLVCKLPSVLQLMWPNAIQQQITTSGITTGLHTIQQSRMAGISRSFSFTEWCYHHSKSYSIHGLSQCVNRNHRYFCGTSPSHELDSSRFQLINRLCKTITYQGIGSVISLYTTGLATWSMATDTIGWRNAMPFFTHIIKRFANSSTAGGCPTYLGTNLYETVFEYSQINTATRVMYAPGSDWCVDGVC